MMPNPSRPDLRARLLQLAIDYHKAEEGEYGCNGATCPAVQRLLSFAERAAGAALLAAGSGEPETPCSAIHDTGAVCELPKGHTQNHRGPFQHGIAQWQEGE